MNNEFQYKIFDYDFVNVYGLTKNLLQIYIDGLFKKLKKNILIVANTLYDATELYNNMGDKADVLLFPVDEYIDEKYLLKSPELSIIRVNTLNKILDNSASIVITNKEGYKKLIPTKTKMSLANIDLKKGKEINREKLLAKLQQNGYVREALVTKTGEFSVRGFIIDIFPINEENPIRIEFFDNEIEAIKYFDTDSQISNKELEKISIIPFNDNFKIGDETIFEFLNPSIIVNYDNTDTIKKTSSINKTKTINIYELNNYVDVSRPYEKYNSKQIETFNGNIEKIKKFLDEKIENGKTVIICFEDDRKIREFIKLLNIKYVITDEDNIKKKTINIIKSKAKTGFELGENIYLSEDIIFSGQKSNNYKAVYKLGKRKTDNNIEYGDYVVHVNHGIGRYLGIDTITKDGIKKDYIKIQYKGNDRLYIPVDKIKMINKYSSGEGSVPQLSKLNSNQWNQQKAYVRKKVQKIAIDLIELSAARKKDKGYCFLQDDEEQIKFEEEFEYVETEDQLKAIKDVKKDMQEDAPMDRLICGDVGYGKTEVAFRAIFKAIKSGKQVAFLCPTTILSSQHYRSAKKRFKNYGINIELLNRFTTQKNKKIVFDNIRNGITDLIIGTHSILNEKIEYKDLGLLIIDEEQRFGVIQKEKIKKYKHTVDVLTLSATPIPRTLQMSLVGIRNLSIIETPPINRYPIQTYVLPKNENVIKDAIYKEISRGGQVFILYNNVEKIIEVVSKIQQLVKDVKIGFVHGKMGKQEIEKSMEEFINNKYSVLVCTTIIETGIDIRNVNTLIVLNSDYFGLSQLYQIRGRIGRGDRIAYAYLMYDEKKLLSDVARKRLSAIKEFTDLGSGYLIAERDLAIRGAGDILGSEQSGFINIIGYDLYLKILNEEVEKLKGNDIQKEEEDKTETMLNVETHISNEYVSDEEIKIEIHKKIGEISTEKELYNIKCEIENRFGKVNEKINIYMHEKLFENIAKKVGVIEVVHSKTDIILSFPKENKNIKEITNKLLKINNNIYIKITNKAIKVNLKIIKLDTHYIYYLLDIVKTFL